MAIRVPVIVDAQGGDLARAISQDVEQGARGARAVGREIGQDLGRGATQGLASSLDVDQEFAQEGRESGRQFGRGLSQSLKSGLAPVEAQAGRTGQEAGESFADGFTRDAAGRLRNAQGQYVKAGEDAGKGFTDGFSKRSGDGAKGGADAFSGKLGGALKAGLAGVAIAAAAALTAGFIGAMEKEKQVDRITATLALTDSQAQRAGEVAGSLYAGAWGDSMEEVTGAVEAVISSIDGMANASRPQLESVTASILDISTAFDQDVSESARNAGILIRTGLAGDATEAADLMTRAFQSVPVALRGGVTDATEEYAQFFAAVGFDGPEALGLLTGALQAGQFGVDKMGDALKEFGIRATELDDPAVTETLKQLGIDAQDSANALLAGGDTANEAFTKIVNGLLAIDDPAEQAAAAVAVFGTPLEDLGKTEIPAFLQSLVSTESALTGVEGAAASMGDTLNDNVATRLEALKRGAETLLTEGIGALFTAFDQGSAIAVRFASAFAGAAVAFEPVRVALVELATEAGSRLGPVFADVASKIETSLLPALNDFAAAMAPIVEFIVKNVGPQIVGVFEAVGTVLGGLVDIVAGVFSTIAAVISGDWSGAWDGVLKILRGAVKVVRGALDALLNVFGLSFSRIGTIASQAWSGIGRFFSNGASGALRTVRNLAGSVLNAFNSLRSRALYAIGFLWGRVTALFRSGASRMGQAAGAGVGRVLSFFQGLPGRIGRAIGNLGSLLYTAGRNVVQGLINGIVSMISRLAGAAGSLATTIRNYLPFSPAKVGPLSGSGSPDIAGEVIAQMIADGIQQNTNLPAQAMQRALSPLTPTGIRNRSTAAQGAPVGAAGGGSGVTVNQVFNGPTTSGGRLREMTWNIRYATQARSEVIEGVAT